MRDYDLLICPAASVAPFPVEERYVGYREGLPPSEYYRWLSIAAAVTATTLPVTAIPCGRTQSGLPVGLQLIGRPHGELETLLNGKPHRASPQNRPLHSRPRCHRLASHAPLMS